LSCHWGTRKVNIVVLLALAADSVEGCVPARLPSCTPLQAQKGPAKRRDFLKAELIELTEASGLSNKPILGDGAVSSFPWLPHGCARVCVVQAANLVV
jgi:hypothetical protein